jgi:hypothetical protein
MISKKSIFLVTAITVALVAIWYINIPTKEGFQTQGYSVNDLDINTCPPSAPEIQTSKGSTDCCTGDLIDGKCNGTTFCTKSPAYPGVSSCVDKWRSYFKDKGVNFCPPTMPNYYENILKGAAPKGCSAGPILQDGTLPKDGTAKQCKIYPNEDDNKTKTDSCYIEKERSKIQCPVVNGNSPPATFRMDWRDPSKFIFFQCEYPYELGMPSQCFDGKTLQEFATKLYPNWRTNSSWVTQINSLSCENYITQRESARNEATRLQSEQRAREAAEKARREEEERRRKAEEEATRRAAEASRLQQQLDEANRRLQNCRR